MCKFLECMCLPERERTSAGAEKQPLSATRAFALRPGSEPYFSAKNRKESADIAVDSVVAHDILWAIISL